MADFTPAELEAAAQEYGMSAPTAAPVAPPAQVAMAPAAPNFSDAEMEAASKEYGMGAPGMSAPAPMPTPAPVAPSLPPAAYPGLQGQISQAPNLFDAFGAGIHGIAEGGYRTLDAAMSPLDGAARGLYAAVYGHDPTERTLTSLVKGSSPQQRMSIVNDFNQMFPAPQGNEMIQNIGRSVIPNAVANYVIPGGGVIRNALNGYLGSGLTDAGEQLAHTGTIAPAQLAFNASTGALTNQALGLAGTAVKTVGGKIASKLLKNSPNVLQNLPGKLNVIDPRHLEGEDLAAHQLLSAGTNLPTSEEIATAKSAAIKAAEKQAAAQQMQEAAMNALRKVTGKPMGSYPVQSLGPVREFGTALYAGEHAATAPSSYAPEAGSLRNWGDKYLPKGNSQFPPMGGLRQWSEKHLTAPQSEPEKPMLQGALRAWGERNLNDVTSPKKGALRDWGNKHLPTKSHDYIEYVPGKKDTPTTVTGDFRYITKRIGYDKLNHAKQLEDVLKTIEKIPGIDTNEVRNDLGKMMRLFAKKTYDETRLHNYQQAVLRQFGKLTEDGVRILEHDKVKLAAQPEQIISPKIQAVLDKVRQAWSPGVNKKNKDSWAGLLGADFDNTKTGYKLFEEDVPKEIGEAVKKLVQLKDTFEGSAKRGTKGQGSYDLYDQAKKALDEKLKNVEKVYQSATGDEKAHLFVRSQIPHPEGLEHGMIDASYHSVAGAQTLKKLEDGVAQKYAAWANLFKSKAITNPRYEDKIKTFDASKYTGLAGAVLTTLDNKALADDGKDNNEQSHTFANIGEALIAAAILHKFGPGITKQFLKNPKLAKASMLFKDTLDHMDYLDNLQGKSGQGIGRDILLHMGAALQNNFGIEFKDQNVKALSLRLLKEAVISPVEALQGAIQSNPTPERDAAAKVFANLTPDQRRVITEHYLNGKTLAGKVRQYAKDLEAFVADPKNKVQDNDILKDAQSALGYVQQAFQPQSKIRTQIDTMLGHSLSNAMDFYFFANPKFHMLNLSDMWISGAARVGPLNIAKANVLLATDKTLKKAFGHSNLTGSFAAERSAASAAGGAKKGFELPDFQSDRINADRVILASFLDFFDKNPRAMQAMGITKQADFARKLVSGQIDPSVTAKAWAHVADVGSRTLGIDPFRVNTDILSRSINSPAFGVFGKQPARFARNSISYLANGDMRGLITQLSSTALLGGRAAMPLELRAAWAAVNPDAEFQAEKDLDRLNIARLLTHNDASSKLDYSLFYPVQAVISPGYAAMKNVPDAVSDLYQSALTIGHKKSWDEVMSDEHSRKAALRFFAVYATAVNSRFAGLPTRQIMNIEKAAEIEYSGKFPISYYTQGSDKPFAPSEKLNMEAANIDPNQVLSNLVLPGEPDFESALHQSGREKLMRKANKPLADLFGTRPYPQQVYSRPQILRNVKDARDPLDN